VQFFSSDLEHMKKRGLDPQKVSSQLALFAKPRTFVHLLAPATLEEGIKKFLAKQGQDLVQAFGEIRANSSFWEFVPASGAASRMFKNWFKLRDQLRAQNPEQLPSGSLGTECLALKHDLPHYAFYPFLQSFLEKESLQFSTLQTHSDFEILLNILLDSNKLGLADWPKGLIPFHSYTSGYRTAFEEHLEEAIFTTMDASGHCRIHFTVPEKYLGKINALLEKTTLDLKKRGLTYTFSLSIQDPSTDTPAATNLNEAFRDASQNMVFRPGGHGALLFNLQQLNVEIVFIKNIDNIAHDRHKKDALQYRQILGAALLNLRSQVHSLLTDLDTFMLSQKPLTPEYLLRFHNFCRNELQLNQNLPMEATAIKSFLYRPLRVAAVVKNEGEPGGGPFWVLSPSGQKSLQIVESAEVNLQDPAQKQIWESSTHFNPVDMVCCLRDHKNQPFDLSHYVNTDAFFISEKTQDGRPLRALELPGLWNGAMAGWLTQFVEAPVTTFTPVKEITDLLKPSHQ